MNSGTIQNYTVSYTAVYNSICNKLAPTKALNFVQNLLEDTFPQGDQDMIIAKNRNFLSK